MLRISSTFLNSLRNCSQESWLKNGCVVVQKRKYSLGELFQRFRFKYMNTSRHHLDYDKWCKIFAFEGNIGAGKSKVAQEFAEKLDLKFYPTTSIHYLIDRDRGAFSDEWLDWMKNPESVVQRCDGVLSLDHFTKEPTDWVHTLKYQEAMLKNRLAQYCDMMVHLLETGQGIASVRQFYSDVVFAEAMLQNGWFRKDMYNHYELMSAVADHYLLRPQVVVYLDIPAEQIYESIQASGDEMDKRLPLDYLRQIEAAYKNIYLPSARQHGVTVIELDWTNPLPIDQVIEILDEMEDLNASTSRWKVKDTIQLKRFIRLSKEVHFRLSELDIFFDHDDFVRSQTTNDSLDVERALHPHSSRKGMNASLGDKYVWLKEV